jgi:class 3 adenylate cyclase
LNRAGDRTRRERHRRPPKFSRAYPLAHENDPERAARAALSIQRALADLNRKNADAGKPELVARIGLETGPAVVDERVSEPALRRAQH